MCIPNLDDPTIPGFFANFPTAPSFREGIKNFFREELIDMSKGQQFSSLLIHNPAFLKFCEPKLKLAKQVLGHLK
jgi:hypothetical protein